MRVELHTKPGTSPSDPVLCGLFKATQEGRVGETRRTAAATDSLCVCHGLVARCPYLEVPVLLQLVQLVVDD
jgi:hypothetical protein